MSHSARSTGDAGVGRCSGCRGEARRPLIGRVADATSLRTALAPLVLMPALSRLLFRTLPEPAGPGRADAQRAVPKSWVQ
ncbi:hypothetical protein [Streptomyces flaveolus]|uniref:hypothetical protein n=1 Tax=Streptomyces flaveolus TaxID=67297 RepID=UPI003F5742F2